MNIGNAISSGVVTVLKESWARSLSTGMLLNRASAMMATE